MAQFISDQLRFFIEAALGSPELRDQLVEILENTGDVHWKSPVATFSDLPSDDNSNGDVRVTLDSSVIYVWDSGSSSWTTNAGGSGIISLNGLTASSQMFANGTSGTAPAFSSVTDTHTLNIPLASVSSVTAGLLSNLQYNSFNNKATDSFTIIQTDSGTSPTALNATSTLTLTSTDLVISGDSSTNTVTYSLNTVPINKGGTGQTTAPNAINALLPSQTGNSGKVLTTNGTIASWSTSSGTVTSVSFTAPSDFTVTGSPITSSGTIALTRNSESQNLFLASPNGSAGVPTYRSIVASDIPSLNYASSVALALPSSVFGISGSPVTSTGTLTGSFVVQSANLVFAGPSSGGSTIPTFRLLAATDIPNNNANTTGTSSNVTGTVLVPNGGTGLATTPTDGQLLIGSTSGNNYSLASLTAGTGISITPGSGSISIASTVTGGVTSLAAFGSSPNANAATISGTTLNLQPASGSFPGGVSTTTQTFAGSKTFSSPTIISDTSTAALTINSTAFIFDATNNTLGIGVQPATTTFIDAINSTGAAKRLVFTGYGTGSTVGTRGRFARGTSGSPAAAQSGDILNFFSGQGYGTSQFPATSTAAINAIAGETFTNTSNLTYLTFQTTPTGSVTIAESARIASTGVTLGPQSSSTASHQINGGLNWTVRTITASTFTVDTTTTDYIIYTDSTSNAIAITLPAPTAGRELIIQDKTGLAGTNAITIKQHSSETINGLTQIVLNSNYSGTTLTSDGTNWLSQAPPVSGVSFLTSGVTYTTPVNTTPQTRFKFTLIGGGGGGSGMNTTADSAGGGGGGGACVVYTTGLSANTGYTIQVGAAGSGGISNTNVATNGTLSKLIIGATTYTANGGLASGGGTIAASQTGGAGGTSINGTINIQGQRGSDGVSVNTASGGVGGSSGLAFGMGGGAVLGASGGFSATGFGGGGGGAHGTVATGGAGSAGCILVEWWN